jgi:uncharacterized cupredoxin-like copper-binding protein
MSQKQSTAMRRAPRIAGAGVAAALIVAGCGGGGGSSSTPTASATGSTAPSASATSGAGGQGSSVTVDEVDFKISLSTTTFKAGSYTFTVKNDGQSTHALQIDGPGLNSKTSPTVNPGESTTLSVTLQSGSYELSCPIDGHKAFGMDTHITVT